jgi:hypothetical protein
VKINNKIVLDDLLLAEIDTIWRMERHELWALTDKLWDAMDDDHATLIAYYGDDLLKVINDRWDEIHAAEEREKLKTVTVDGVEYKTVSYFHWYVLGWEMDAKGFVVDKDGKQAFVLTNHGTPHFAEPKEIEAKIKELNRATKAMKSALASVELNG